MLSFHVFVAAHPRRSLDSFSRPTRTPRRPSPNSHRILSFTSFASLTSSKSFSVNPLSDPHPLNRVASIFYKNTGGTEASPFFKLSTFSLQRQLLTSSNHPLSFLRFTLSFAQRSSHIFFGINSLRTLLTPTEGVPPSLRIPPLATHHSSLGLGRRRSVLLANCLLAPGRYSDGLTHVRVGFLARFAVALITMFKVLKILLKNSRANLAQAFLVGFVQCGLCRMLGTFVWMCPELLDGVKGAPVSPVLPFALSRHLFVQGVNQEVIGPQDESEARDPKNHEPLEHAAEPTASPKFILADCFFWRAARGKAIISVRAETSAFASLGTKSQIERGFFPPFFYFPFSNFSFISQRLTPMLFSPLLRMSRPRGQGNTCPFPGLPASFLPRSRVVN